MNLADLLIASAVLAATGWLLARSVRRGGGCHGCGGGCARQPRDAGLVRLGRGRRDGRSSHAG